MSVKAKFQQIPVTVFDRMGDVAFNVTYRSRLPDNYVPGGTVSTSWEDHTVRVIQDEYTLHEVGVSEGIREHDFKLLIASKELPITPKPDDHVVMPDGRTVNVINFTTDPAAALYTLQVRG